MSDIAIRLRTASGGTLEASGITPGSHERILKIVSAITSEAADEIERLQAIVDKYPKNAEGVSVWPGMIQWLCTSPGYTLPKKCRVLSVMKYSAAIVMLNDWHGADCAFCSTLYSSPEAVKEPE